MVAFLPGLQANDPSENPLPRRRLVLVATLFLSTTAAAQSSLKPLDGITHRAALSAQFAQLVAKISDTEKVKQLLKCRNFSDEDASLLVRLAQFDANPDAVTRPISAAKLDSAASALGTPCGTIKADTGVVKLYEVSSATVEVVTSFSPIPVASGLTGQAAEKAAQQGSPGLTGLALESAVVNGLASFLMDRAMQELVYSFLERLKSKKDDPVRRELSVLFPATQQTLDDMTQFGAGVMLPALRAAAITDLDSLPMRVVSRTPVEDTPGTKLARGLISNGLRLAKQLRNGTPPASVLAELRNLSASQFPDQQTWRAMTRVGALAYEYQRTAGQLTALLANPAGRRYFAVAFVWNEIDRGALAIDEAEELYTRCGANALAVVDHVRQLQAAVVATRQRLDSTRQDRVASMAAILQQTASTAGLASTLLPEVSADQSKAIIRVTGYLEATADIFIALEQRDYAKVLIGAISASEANGFKISPKLRQFAAFSASIATAQSSQQVTEALQAAALPVSSYRAKRLVDPGMARTSFTLNSYVGLGGGRETVEGVGLRQTSTYYAPAMQIGPEVSWAINICGWKGWSLGVFVPILDLGAIASVRTEPSTVPQEATVGFAQVFAPGLFGVLGISSKMPFSFGAGIQQVPQLRKVGATKHTGVRELSMFLAVDIPLFRF